MIGIAVITAALVIILSAFNGIEKMIQHIYSEFDSDITITAAKGKTFIESEVDWVNLAKIDGVKSFSRAIEEIVVLRHEKKWVNATLLGVEKDFLDAIQINKKTENDQFVHLISGEGVLIDKNYGQRLGLIGVGLMQKLNLQIGNPKDRESVLIYAPKRNIKLRPGKTPFNTDRIFLAGAINYNREVNEEIILWLLDNTRDLLRYKNELTHILVDVDPKSGFSNDDVKQKISQILGPRFKLKTNYEKNELIYQTSKSERLVVVVILIFIFILASFNLIASLTMLFLEKKDNMFTLKSMGLTNNQIFQVFLLEGLLISGFGMVIGLIIGYATCFIQLFFELIVIPGPNLAFPVSFSWSDFFLILCSISCLSFIFSYFPVRVLIRNGKQLDR
jgi:lipoprotein-releasing system permease protein